MASTAINFRLPGPTPLPPAVLDAMQREMISHRGATFKALYRDILSLAKQAHRTDGDIFTWPASGSAGWEAAIVNLLSPGDKVLAAVCGDFGDRFAKVGATFGLDVERLDVEWGRAVTPAVLAAALGEHHGVKAVFLTHNETSTGVTNPLQPLARVVNDYGALTIVDAVSSVGGVPLEMDAWGLDFVFSGSQKAWMCPPGLLIAAVGPKAWRAHAASTFPRFFWDLTAAKTNAADGMTSTTPPLTLLYAYHAALEMMLAEGLEQVWARHRALGELTRSGVEAIGLELFAERAYASSTVTAFRPPAGMTSSDVVAAVLTQGVELQIGQGHLRQAVVRIGHMGWAHEPELRHAVTAIDAALAGTARETALVAFRDTA
jgi:aspartate aminotransferase-like enzyme